MWVCDGTEEDVYCLEDPINGGTMEVTYLYLHMNWGWYGDYNGWFAFDDFSPGSYNFNSGKEMFYNINP